MADYQSIYTGQEVDGCVGGASYIGAEVGTGGTPAAFNAETDTVHVTSQTLSAAQKAQARANIEAVSSAEGVVSSTIRNIVTISQSDYNNLSSKVSTTLYIII